ncbi:MAG: hypothetical protein ACD_14C00009G0003 [uncultured bacterium]|nr:MAG: hypothetical protein ACD_14C00009G0003 [uncultured bacterium]
MKFRRIQLTAIFVLISLFTLTSGFCYGTIASANMTETIEVSARMSDMDDCGRLAPASIQVEKNIPLSDTILPCCVDRHNNVSISLANELNEKINLSDISTVPAVDIVIPDIQQKTYIASTSPPQKPDILSSVVKKE